MKRLLSGLLSLTMVFSLTPSTIVLADGEDNSGLVTQSEEGTGQETNDSSEKIGGAETTSKSEENSGSVDLNTMSSDELFEYLLNVDDMDALYEKYPNLNDLISKLSEDQQSQLAKKFGNSEEDVETIEATNNTISPSSGNVKITEAGEYTIEGGTYNVESWYAIEIETSGEVVLNINGDISSECNFIYVYSGTVTINARKDASSSWKLTQQRDGYFVNADLYSTVTFNGGDFYGKPWLGSYAFCTLKFNDCTFNGDRTFIAAKNVEMNSVKYKNTSEYTYVEVFHGGNIKLSGSSTFYELASNSECDIKLTNDSTITIDDSFSNTVDRKLIVNLVPTFTEDDEMRKVTTDTTEGKMDVISSGDGYVLTKQSGDLYFKMPPHSYKVTVNDGTLIKKCTDEGCDSTIELACLTIPQEVVSFTGRSYSSSNIGCYSNEASASELTYKAKEDSDTTYEESATPPTYPGKYTVSSKVSYKGKTYDLTKDFEITNTIEQSSKAVTISKGGTYNIAGGIYDVYDEYDTTSKNVVVIDTTEDVTLNVLGYIEYIGSDYFIEIKNTGNVEINAGDYEVKGTSSLGLIYVTSNAAVTVNGGSFVYKSNAIMATESNKTLTLNGCTFDASEKNTAIGAKNIKVKNCHFKGTRSIDFCVIENGNISLSGTNKFDEGADNNILLQDEATISFGEDYSINAPIKLSLSDYSSITSENPKRVIATSGVSENMAEMITSTNESYPVYFGQDNDGNGYLYLWNHTHEYTDTDIDNGNSLIAKCSDCDSSIVLATLKAPNSNFTGFSYGGAKVDLNNGCLSSITVGNLKYKEKDAKDEKFSETEPTQVGEYTASVDVSYNNKTYTLTTDFKITNTITPSSNTVTITKGGAYNVEGGTYKVSEGYAIDIHTSEDVTLNIKGDVVCDIGGFVNVQSESGNVTINAKKEDDSNYNITLNDGKAMVISSLNLVTLNGGNYINEFSITVPYNIDGGSLKLNDCSFTGESQYSSVIFAKYVEIKNCTFNNDYYTNLSIKKNGNVTIEGANNNFSTDYADVSLDTGATLTLKDDFKNKDNKKLTVEVSLDSEEKQLIMENVSEDVLDKIVQAGAEFEGCTLYTKIFKDGNLYFWNHTHEWNYTVDTDNGKISAKCTSSSDCDYYSKDLSATLSAKDVLYDGQPYSGLTVTDDITSVTGASKSIRYVGRGDTTYDSTDAPTDIGDYTVQLSIGDETISKDFSITNTITPSSNTVTITKGGTYNIDAGTFMIPHNGYAITIDTTENVVLNILGDITCDLNSKYVYGFVNVKNTGEVQVKANGHKITGKNDNSSGKNVFYILNVASNTKVTLDGGEYSGFCAGVYSEDKYSSSVILENCSIRSDTYRCVEAQNVTVKDCSFSGKNLNYGLKIGKILTIEGSNNKMNGKFSDGDVYLSNSATITLKDGTQFNDEDYKLKIALYKTTLQSEGDKKQVTKDTSESMMDKITSAQNYSTMNKNGNLYFWKHTHIWTYKVVQYTDDDSSFIIANCSNEDCIYHTDDSLDSMLGTEPMTYTGKEYNGAEFDNFITSTTGDEPSDIYYEGRDGTSYTKSTIAPINVGKYTASITLGGVTCTANFEITKADQEVPSGVSSTNETIKGKKDGSITGVDSSMEYRKDGDKEYTSIDKDKVTGLASGTYYVRYAGDKNHNASDDVSVTISSSTTLLNVTVPKKQSGCTLSVDHSSVDYNGSSKITFKLADGYSKTDDFAVKVNGNRINLDADDTYTIKDIQSDQSITVDGVADITKPVISGIEDGKTYTKTQKFSVDDTNLAEVKVDGKVVTDYTLVPKNGSYEISASDTAGNTTSITVTVNYEVVSVPSIASKTYTGETLKADIENSDLYKVISNVGGTNVGTYSVELTLKDSVNYKWKDSDQSTVSVPFKIERANPNLNVSPVSEKMYGDDKFTLNVTKSGSGTLSYLSSDEKVVKIDSSGNVSIVGAGSATLKVMVKESDNYNSGEATVTVKVNPKSIAGATVTLGKALVYTGSEQTQEVKSVKLDGKDVTYKVSGNVVTDAGKHTLTVTGTGNFNGTVSVDYVVASNKMEETDDGKVSVGEGKATVEVKGDAKLETTKAELLEMLIQNGSISAEQLKLVYSGSDLNVSLNVKEYVGLDEGTKSKMIDGAGSSGLTISKQFLNITLLVNNDEIHSTGMVKASVVVPDNLINTDSNLERTYYMVRYHEGKVKCLKGSFNEKTHSFTFETDKFSAYALAYKDVVKKTSGEKETKKDYGKGTIVLDSNGSNSDLIDSLIASGDITEEELKNVSSGSTLNISLKVTDVSDRVSSEVKSTIQQKANELGYTVGDQYVDINLYKDAKIIKTTSGKVKASVSVPDTMVNTNSNVKRTYYVIGYCDGKVVTIEGMFDEETKSFTFETNQFSTYVLAYKDTTVKQSETKKTESKKDSKKNTNTGVQSNMGLYISLVIVSMIGLVVLVRKKKVK